jgi:hypothetical protein
MKSKPTSKASSQQPDPKVVERVRRDKAPIWDSSLFSSEQDQAYIPLGRHHAEPLRPLDFGRRSW